jgi:multidrug efflux pump subunit AcrA (membrane-fusion protein)
MADPPTSDYAAPASWRRTTIRLALPLGLLAIGISGMSALVSMRKPTGRVEPEKPIPLVSVQAVPAQTGAFRLYADGVVVPKREITVAAEVAGRVTWVSPEFRAGRFIAKGTKLLEIDPQVYRLAVQQSEAERAQLEADLAQVQVEAQNLTALLELSARELDLAVANLRRAKELYDPQRNIRNLTPAQYEAVESALLKAQNAHQQLENSRALLASRRQKVEAQLQLIGFKLQQAQLDLDRTVITAPLAGVISAQEVEADDFVQRGTVLFQIVDTEHVEVRSQIRTDDLYWIWATRHSSAADPLNLLYEPPRVPVNIFYEVAGQRYQWQGYLSRYEGAGLESTTRTVPVLFEVPQPHRPGALEGPPTLIRGMYVQVEMEIEPKVPLLRLPIEALRPPNIVWTVDATEPRATSASQGDANNTHLTAAPAGRSAATGGSAAQPGKLRYHEVRVAKLLPDAVLIRADNCTVKPGDRVVVSPLAAGIDQMDVQFQHAADARPRSAAGPRSAGDPVREPSQPDKPAAQPDRPQPPMLQRS